MSSLQIPFPSSSSSQKGVHAYAAIAVPELTRVRISLPTIPTSSSTTKLVHQSNIASINTITPAEKRVANTQMLQDHFSHLSESKAKIQLYAILEAVSDRIELHNMGEQRNNWNSLLLNSVDIMMVGLKNAIHNTALKLTSTLWLTAAKGILLIINKIRTPQRKATTLFTQLQTDIETKLTQGNPTEEDVNSAMERVLALEKAYPLHLLLGTMPDRFPSKFQPNDHQMKVCKSQKRTNNGWSPELEMEMRQIIEVVKRKDMKEYEKQENLAFKINKTLAILGPLLTGIAALSTVLERHGSCWAGTVAVAAGSLADCINALEHGRQVGMVFEMSRNCGCFCKLLQETIEATLEEKDTEKRENGELLEMKVAMKLGRSVSQLRQLASKFAAYDSEGIEMDEFASKDSAVQDF